MSFFFSGCTDHAKEVKRSINIANPAAPTEVGFYGTPGNARGVAVDCRQLMSGHQSRQGKQNKANQ